MWDRIVWKMVAITKNPHIGRSSKKVLPKKVLPKIEGTVVEIGRFEPWPWQTFPWRDKDPVMLLGGSAGGGKSRLAAEKIHGFLLHYANATAVVSRKAEDADPIQATVTRNGDLTDPLVVYLSVQDVDGVPDSTEIAWSRPRRRSVINIKHSPDRPLARGAGFLEPRLRATPSCRPA